MRSAPAVGFESAQHTSTVLEATRYPAEKLLAELQFASGCDLTPADLHVWLDNLFCSWLPDYLATTGAVCKNPEEFQTIYTALLDCGRTLVIDRCALLALKGELASSFMSLIQLIVDGLSVYDPLRIELLDVLLQLAVESNIVPKCLDISGISNCSNRAVCVGGFGDVWMANLGESLVALKTPRLIIDEAKLHRNLCREALLWRQLSHPHILTFLGLCRDMFEFPAIVSPWMQNGDVLQFVKKQPQTERLTLLAQIAKALSYLHGHTPPIVHQDIRCANILINDQNQAVLADFGLTRLDSAYFNTLTSSLEHGCTRWQAPELLFPGAGALPNPTWGSDIWAFGMVVLELFTERPPYAGTAIDAAVVIDVYHGRSPERPAEEELKGAGFSDCLWNCLRACWHKEPTRRPRADALARILPQMYGLVSVGVAPATRPEQQLQEESVLPKRASLPLPVLPAALPPRPKKRLAQKQSISHAGMHAHAKADGEQSTSAGGAGRGEAPRAHVPTWMPSSRNHDEIVCTKCEGERLPASGEELISPMLVPVQHTDTAAAKETQHLRRRCWTCKTETAGSWRRSRRHPGEVVCGRCAQDESLSPHPKRRPKAASHLPPLIGAREALGQLREERAEREVEREKSNMEQASLATLPEDFADSYMRPVTSSLQADEFMMSWETSAFGQALVELETSIVVPNALLQTILGPSDANKAALEAVHHVRICVDVCVGEVDGAVGPGQVLLACAGARWSDAVNARKEIAKLVEFQHRFGGGAGAGAFPGIEW